MATRSAQVQALKNKLTELYTEHNPDNINKIDYLISKYVNQEHLLYTSVCQKYDITADPLTRKVKEWDAATGKNTSQIICATTGELLETLEEEEDEDEYDPFNTHPSEKDKLTEESIKVIDCHLLGIKESTLFKFPLLGGEVPELKKVTAVDSMGEL